MHYVDSVIELIGNTPLVRLNKVTEGIVPKDGPIVLAKVEYLNPGGSIKDRIAVRMIDAAEEEGLLKPGGTIVEPTSGNTGVGLAMVAQQRGYHCIFVCPDKVSEDKRNVLRAYGADVVVCPTAVDPEDPRSYYSVSDRLARETPGGWKPDQYSNPHNPRSHYEVTGPEVWDQTQGRITHFVAGVGTGGTITGTGRYLKEVSDGAVKIIGADPKGSVYSGGTGRPYLVEGVGEDFWPTTYDQEICDEIIAVSDAESFEMTRRLAREEGLLVGGSCGMAAVAALRVASAAEPGDVIVAYAGEPVEDSLDLQRRVVGTRPGTGVAVEVVRNGEPVTLDVTIGELDLEAEGRSVMAASAEEETSEGFGITLQDLTPQAMRGLGVPDDTVGAVVAGVASGSTAEAGGLQSGDVILSVNRAEVASAAEAGAALDAIEAGRTAFVLVQRRDTRVFLQLQKEQ